VSKGTKEGSSNEESSGTGRPDWVDRLVPGRELVLDLITGTHVQAVLNKYHKEQPVIQAGDADLTAELKRFMDLVKVEALDRAGYSVDYQHLKESEAYLEYRQHGSPRLRNFDPEVLTSREEKLAFWINLYNALIMDGVIAGEITQSVAPNSLALLGFFRKTAYEIAGMRVSVDDLEHGILRGNRGHPLIPGPQFTSSDRRLSWITDPMDVRIHFALNCAGRSCPPIQVYSAEKIDQQLELAARNFVNADLWIDRERKRVHLSAIFKWYAGDFGGKQGVSDFLIAHLGSDLKKDWLETHRGVIEFKYKAYDWGLNSIKMA